MVKVIKLIKNPSLITKSFEVLYPYVDVNRFTFYLEYSGRFKSYNAHIQYRYNTYTFKLSKEWIDVTPDIVVGLIQYLLLKAFKGKLEPISEVPLNVELYNSFLQKVHKYTPKTKSDPVLLEVFERINEKFFSNSMELVNLKWGSLSTRTLGHYSYGNDTITMSKVFQHITPDEQYLMDFVMYHEMLHKKHKFYVTGTGKNIHHSTAFRRDEKLFGNIKQIDKDLNIFLSKFRKRKSYQRTKSPSVKSILRKWLG